MNRMTAALLFAASVLVLTGCSAKNENTLPESTLEAVENLNDLQKQYAEGIAPLIEIPDVWAQELYDHYDAITELGTEGAPSQLREYAQTNTVYFDYEDDFSVVWNKDDHQVTIEPTDVSERDAFSEKMHR